MLDVSIAIAGRIVSRWTRGTFIQPCGQLPYASLRRLVVQLLLLLAILTVVAVTGVPRVLRHQRQLNDI